VQDDALLEQLVLRGDECREHVGEPLVVDDDELVHSSGSLGLCESQRIQNKTKPYKIN